MSHGASEDNKHKTITAKNKTKVLTTQAESGMNSKEISRVKPSPCNVPGDESLLLSCYLWLGLIVSLQPVL